MVRVIDWIFKGTGNQVFWLFYVALGQLSPGTEETRRVVVAFGNSCGERVVDMCPIHTHYKFVFFHCIHKRSLRYFLCLLRVDPFPAPSVLHNPHLSS